MIPSTKPRIPGPAGMLKHLQSTNAAPPVIQAALSEALRGLGSQQGCVVAATGAGSSHAALADMYPSWRAAMDCFDILMHARHPMLEHNVASVLGQSRTFKVPKVLVVLASLSYSPTGGASVILKDATGSMKAAVHQIVLDQHSHFVPGATLALKQVTVICPLPGVTYMCITLDNVMQVFPASAGPPSSQLTANTTPVGPAAPGSNTGSGLGNTQDTAGPGTRLIQGHYAGQTSQLNADAQRPGAAGNTPHAPPRHSSPGLHAVQQQQQGVAPPSRNASPAVLQMPDVSQQHRSQQGQQTQPGGGSRAGAQVVQRGQQQQRHVLMHGDDDDDDDNLIIQRSTGHQLRKIIEPASPNPLRAQSPGMALNVHNNLQPQQGRQPQPAPAIIRSDTNTLARRPLMHTAVPGAAAMRQGVPSDQRRPDMAGHLRPHNHASTSRGVPPPGVGIQPEYGVMSKDTCGLQVSPCTGQQDKPETPGQSEMKQQQRQQQEVPRHGNTDQVTHHQGTGQQRQQLANVDSSGGDDVHTHKDGATTHGVVHNEAGGGEGAAGGGLSSAADLFQMASQQGPSIDLRSAAVQKQRKVGNTTTQAVHQSRNITMVNRHAPMVRNMPGSAGSPGNVQPANQDNDQRIDTTLPTRMQDVQGEAVCRTGLGMNTIVKDTGPVQVQTGDIVQPPAQTMPGLLPASHGHRTNPKLNDQEAATTAQKQQLDITPRQGAAVDDDVPQFRILGLSGVKRGANTAANTARGNDVQKQQHQKQQQQEEQGATMLQDASSKKPRLLANVRDRLLLKAGTLQQNGSTAGAPASTTNATPSHDTAHEHAAIGAMPPPAPRQAMNNAAAARLDSAPSGRGSSSVRQGAQSNALGSVGNPVGGMGPDGSMNSLLPGRLLVGLRGGILGSQRMSSAGAMPEQLQDLAQQKPQGVLPRQHGDRSQLGGSLMKQGMLSMLGTRSRFAGHDNDDVQELQDDEED